MPITTLPEALARVRELEAKVKALELLPRPRSDYIDTGSCWRWQRVLGTCETQKVDK